MKILNNNIHTNIVGLHVVCNHCGLELEIEKTDAINLYKKFGRIFNKKDINYEGKKMFLLTEELGDLYTVKCVVCGELIGFFEYGKYSFDNACILNPERYWICSNYEWYIGDYSERIIMDVMNKSNKSLSQYTEFHGTPDKYITIRGNQRIPVYGRGIENVLDDVSKHCQITDEIKEQVEYRIKKGLTFELVSERISGYINHCAFSLPNTLYKHNIREGNVEWAKDTSNKKRIYGT